MRAPPVPALTAANTVLMSEIFVIAIRFMGPDLYS